MLLTKMPFYNFVSLLNKQQPPTHHSTHYATPRIEQDHTIVQDIMQLILDFYTNIEQKY